MFVAALLDLEPELQEGCTATLRLAGCPPEIEASSVRASTGGFAGRRFVVQGNGAVVEGGRYRELDQLLASAPLEPPVRERARAIFALLAEAEAAIHGAPVEHVHFHELAGWDSFVDILAAAYLIDAQGSASWSVSALPLGRGRVRTAHGFLPVPAPATARLLEGFVVEDDGVGGERVTPTGAAILRHLAPTGSVPVGFRLSGCGHGLGTRQLPGIPNMLRLLAFAATSDAERELIGIVRFEIDDQTAEDLALGLDRLRAHPGVVDVVQWPVVGKRGRLANAVQVLTRPAALDEVAAACLQETSTLGCRTRVEERRVLPREQASKMTEHGTIRVKRTVRPGGAPTVKAELQDIEATGLDFAGRAKLRRETEEP